MRKLHNCKFVFLQSLIVYFYVKNRGPPLQVNRGPPPPADNRMAPQRPEWERPQGPGPQPAGFPPSSGPPMAGIPPQQRPPMQGEFPWEKCLVIHWVQHFTRPDNFDGFFSKTNVPSNCILYCE